MLRRVAPVFFFTLLLLAPVSTQAANWQFVREDYTDYTCPYTDTNKPRANMANCPSANPTNLACTAGSTCKVNTDAGNNGSMCVVNTKIYACPTTTEQCPLVEISPGGCTLTGTTWETRSGWQYTGTAMYSSSGNASSCVAGCQASGATYCTHTADADLQGGGTTHSCTGYTSITSSSAVSPNPRTFFSGGEPVQRITVTSYVKEPVYSCTSPTYACAQPNLTAGGTSNASYNPSGAQWLVTGTGSTFAATVSNTGNALATNFPNIFQIADNNISSTIAMIAGQTHTLGAGGSTGITGAYTFANPATYKVRACANYNTSWGGSVAESSTADNCGPWVDYIVTPRAPTGLSYSCNASGVATLSWTAPSGGAAGYYVRISPTNGGSCPAGWQLAWGTTCIPNPDHVAGTSITFGALFGQTYSWSVYGKNSGGEYGPPTSSSFMCSGSPNLTAGTNSNASYNPAGYQWLIAGTASTFSATVSNTGNALATNFPNVFQIADSGLTYTLAMVAGQTHTLGAGGSTGITGAYTFANPGYYKVRACANYNTSWGGSVAESSTADNCGPWVDYIVTPAAPTGLTASCNASDIATLSWTAPSGGSPAYYVRVAPPNPGNTCPVGWQYVWGTTCIPNPDNVSGTSIQFGGVTGQSYSWGVHSKSTGGEWGTWTPGPPFTCSGSIDLSVGSVTPTTAVAGTPVNLTATVSNGGTASAPASITSSWIRNGSGTVIYSNDISTPLISAGGSSVRTQAYTFSAAGTYTVRFCADNTTGWIGSVTETDEGNNCGPWTTVTVSAPNPTADLTANPTTVVTGNSSTLSWSSTNAASCTGTGFNTGGATSGSVSTGALSATTNYQVTCGSASDTASVSVTTPTADITASPDRVRINTASALTWTSSQVSTCTVTGTNGFSQSALSGTSVSTGPLTTQTTFSISCDGGVATDSVIVNIVPRFEEF